MLQESFTHRNCIMHQSVCKGKSKVLYVWANDAPPANIPDDVGFKIANPYSYIILQLHYAHPLPSPDDESVEITFTEKE